MDGYIIDRYADGFAGIPGYDDSPHTIDDIDVFLDNHDKGRRRLLPY